MFKNNELIFILICIVILFNTYNIDKFEPFNNLFNHNLYYSDVDCLLTKENSCIIKPNNDSFYDYNTNCKKNKLMNNKYYEKVNSTCIDCLNNHNIIESFDGRANYDRKNNIFYKTNSPGLITKDTECSYGYIKNIDGYCQLITY